MANRRITADRGQQLQEKARLARAFFVGSGRKTDKGGARNGDTGANQARSIYGVYVDAAVSTTAASNGSITLTGRGGNALNNFGVYLTSAGPLTAARNALPMDKQQRFRWNRQLGAWEYGSGSDYSL